MKKLLSMSLVVIFYFCFSLTSIAATPADTAYREALKQINSEYNVNIGYYPVDVSEISLEEYIETAKELAIQQKELNHFIENRTETPIPVNINYTSRSTTTKTVTKETRGSYSTYISIKATYNVTGMTISNPRDISLKYSSIAILYATLYIPQSGYPITNIIDGGRTLTVTYNGTLTTNGATFTNIKLYTEFAYDS